MKYLDKYILNKIGLTYLYIKQLYITQWTLTFNILYDSYLQKLAQQHKTELQSLQKTFQVAQITAFNEDQETTV